MNPAFDRMIEEQVQRKQAEQELVPLLQKLPNEVLRKLATGEAKIADFSGCGNATWLSKFEGTPLYEQALALEAQDIQREMSQIQQDASRQQDWQLEREMRLQRKMLEIQLATLQHEATAKPPVPAGVGAAPPMPTPPPAPPPPAAPEMPPAAAKTAAAVTPFEAELEQYVKVGEELARSDHKAAYLMDAGAQIGINMAKQAFLGGLLAKAAPIAQKALASPLAGKAMNFAVKNPGMVAGGLVGAAGGLASGLRKDENGDRHLLGGLASGVGGAAMGAGAGLGVQSMTGSGGLTGQKLMRSLSGKP